MAFDPLRFGVWSIDDEKWLDTFRRVFENFDILGIVSASSSTEPGRSQSTPAYLSEHSHRRQSIPKVIHHIWLGGELPLHFRQLRQVCICIIVATFSRH
jgi:hypothetical protein